MKGSGDRGGNGGEERVKGRRRRKIGELCMVQEDGEGIGGEEGTAHGPW